MPFRNIYSDGVLQAGDEIIALERAPQSPGLDANDRVILSEVFVAFEHLDRDRVSLQAVRAPR